MVTAKQLGRSALALTLISLSGCQLFQSNTNAEVASPVIVNDHVQSIMVISDQMDMYLSSEGRESFLNQMLVALESDSEINSKAKILTPIRGGRSACNLMSGNKLR